MQKNKMIYGLLSILTLILGFCIYLLFRDINNMVFFNWIPKTNFTKTMLIQLPSALSSNIIKYNFPDMFWFLSGILFFRYIWFFNIKIQKIYIISFYGFGLVLEISQLSKKIFGTFDLLDLLFMGLGAFVEGLLFNVFVRRRIV